VIGAPGVAPPACEFAIRHLEETTAPIVIDGTSSRRTSPTPGIRFGTPFGPLFPKAVVKKNLKRQALPGGTERAGRHLIA
jgi:hypothetical protein